MEIGDSSKFPTEILSIIIGYVITDGKSFFNSMRVSKLFYEVVMNEGYATYQEYSRKSNTAIHAILDKMNDGSVGDFTVKIDQICNGPKHNHYCLLIRKSTDFTNLICIPSTEKEKKTYNSDFTLGFKFERAWFWEYYSNEPFTLHCEKYSHVFQNIISSYFENSNLFKKIEWKTLSAKLMHLLKDIRITPKLKFVIESSPDIHRNETAFGLLQKEGINMESFEVFRFFYKYDK